VVVEKSYACSPLEHLQLLERLHGRDALVLEPEPPCHRYFLLQWLSGQEGAALDVRLLEVSKTISTTDGSPPESTSTTLVALYVGGVVPRLTRQHFAKKL